jgi:hypothetical protein
MEENKELLNVSMLYVYFTIRWIVKSCASLFICEGAGIVLFHKVSSA